MKSNNPPNINPTGTSYRRVRMYASLPHETDPKYPPKGYPDYHTNRNQHTKEFAKVLKVMGDYIRADYAVTGWEEPAGFFNLECRLPLGFPIQE
jgi:hypothetical protein